MNNAEDHSFCSVSNQTINCSIMHTLTHPQLAMALAVFSGSIGSGGAGFLLVLTAQNLHPRVQVSPRSMMVAVAIPSPPPFQHCAHTLQSKTQQKKQRRKK